MRIIGSGIALCAGAILLTLSAGAFAQPQPDPGQPGAPAPGEPPAAAPGATITFGSGGVSTSSGEPAKDEAAQSDQSKKQKKPERLPWHGTSLLLDNSVTTQAVGIGKDYLSNDPVYEMWWSLRPRYYFLENDTHSLNLNLRMDLITEYTNSDSSTVKYEPQFGNIWVNLVYGFTAYKNEDSGWATKLSIGPRVILPTDKYTYDNGTRLQLGGVVGVNQAIPLGGPKATWFPGMSVSGSMAYAHNFMTYTTGVNTNFTREREDINGRTIESDQLSGSPKVNHQLLSFVEAAFDITEKLHFSADYIWIQQWTYKLGQSPAIATDTGPAAPSNLLADPVNYRVLPWFLTSVDYDVIPEFGVSVGYYNLSNQIGPDGQRRNPLWSPDARVFFDITGNLDEIYDTLSGRRQQMEQPPDAGTVRVSRLHRIGSTL